MNGSGSWLTTSKNIFLSGQCWIQKEFTSQWHFENRSLFHSALIINIPLCMDNRCQYSDNDSITLLFLQHHQLWYLFQTQFISLLLASQWSISRATCMFLFILSLSHLDLQKITITTSFIIHLCCAACTQDFDVQCNLFLIFFSLSLLHRLHPSILTFQLSDLSHYISALPAKT